MSENKPNTGPAAKLFDAMDANGAMIEKQFNMIEHEAHQRPLGPLLLGAGIGASVVLGGLASFIIVWFILVHILN